MLQTKNWIGAGLLFFGLSLSASAQQDFAKPNLENPLADTSLAGTVADGSLAVDAGGDLQIDAELKRFYDYFLSARGEIADAQLQAVVHGALSSRLPAAAAAQAFELFEAYMRYLNEAPARLGDGPAEAYRDSSKIGVVYGRLTALRFDYFGEAAEAFFAGDLTREASALRYQSDRLEADDAEALKAARSSWESSLSPAELRDRAASVGPLDLHRRVAELRASGAGDAEVWAARAEAFDSEAADRLARLDAERAQWDRRLVEYRNRLERLERSKLGTAEKVAAVETLLSASFSPLEQKRVRALERLGR